LGEADFLGLARLQSSIVSEAQALESGLGCRLKVLSKPAFQDVLEMHEEDAKNFDRLAREAAVLATPGGEFARVQEAAGKRLLAFLQAGPIFTSCERNFIAELWSKAEGLLLGPGDELPGDASSESPLYVVLAGRVQIEGASGAVLRYAGPGEVLGAAACFGLEDPGQEIMKATRGRPAFCAKVPGQVVAAVLHAPPEEMVRLQVATSAQLAADDSAAGERCKWVAEVAVPALGKTPLLDGCPQEFLQHIAGPLSEVAFSEGDILASCGDAADSMLIILEGMLALESKSGVKIGCLGPGGIVGEPEVLGLIEHRTVTAAAMSPGRLIRVSAEDLGRALAEPSAEPLQEGFKQLVAGRRKQVTANQPLSSLLTLRPNALVEDVAAHLLALRAERLPLEPGVRWQPSSDADPCGPRISIVVRGRVSMEVSDDRAEDLPVKPGSVIPEGLPASYGACFRAVSSDCEVYRIRSFDLLAAAHTPAQAPDWFYQLKILMSEARNWLISRLQNAKNLAMSRVPHPTDERIRAYAEKKKKSMKQAENMKQQLADNYVGSKLPLLPPKQLGVTAFNRGSWGDAHPLAKQSGGYPAAQGAAAGFNALRLRKSRSDPTLKLRGAYRLPKLEMRRGVQQLAL